LLGLRSHRRRQEPAGCPVDGVTDGAADQGLATALGPTDPVSETVMKTLADRFRRWYEYERDCNAKTLAMLASVPAERRTTPEFRKAVDRMAHLVAARQRWLH